MPVDLYALVMLRDLTADRPVELGDTIVVPFKRANVLIEGAVFKPGPYPYNPSFNVEQYLALAGGPNRFAQSTDNVYLVTPKGETKEFAPDLKVEPGASLVVPERNFSRSEVVAIILAGAGLLLSGVTIWIPCANDPHRPTPMTSRSSAIAPGPEADRGGHGGLRDRRRAVRPARAEWYRSVLTVVPAGQQKSRALGPPGRRLAGLAAALGGRSGGGADAARIAAVLQSIAVSDAVIESSTSGAVRRDVPGAGAEGALGALRREGAPEARTWSSSPARTPIRRSSRTCWPTSRSSGTRSSGA